MRFQYAKRESSCRLKRIRHGSSAETFGLRDVRLEFHGIRPSFSNGINEGVRHAQTSVMRLSNLADHETPLTAADFVIDYPEGLGCHSCHLLSQQLVLSQQLAKYKIYSPA